MSEHVSKGHLLSSEREGKSWVCTTVAAVLCPDSGCGVINTFARNNENIGSYAGQKGDR